MARALRWQFVTVTPSDFLAGGAAEVEARAKAIFMALREQRDKVVLLDEIDHFLLDRERHRHRREG
jgi:SpoVK/Ycf46/Vps4 family AAA+-type ATPase